jgi:hypothetical protein
MTWLLIPLALADEDTLSKREQSAWLEHVAADARSFEDTRTGAPFETTPGASSDAYQSAWGSCVPDEGFGKGKEREPGLKHLQRGVRYLDPARRTSSSGTQETPQACQDLGMGATPLDRAQGALNDDACALLARCDAVLDWVSAGSTATTARSPVHAYDAFRLDAAGDARPLGPWMDLARIALGHSLLKSTSAERAGGAMSVLRMGQDLARGGDGRSTRTGVNVQSLALDALGFLVADPAMPADAQLQLALELEHAATSRPELAPIARIDLLQSTAVGWSLVHDGSDLQASFPVGFQPGQPGLDIDTDALPPGNKPALKRFMGHTHLPAWKRLLPQLPGGDHRTRAVTLHGWIDALEDGDHGPIEALLISSSTGLAQQQLKTDARLAVTQARACLLAHGLRLRLGQGDQGPCAVDPLTGEAWQVGESQGWLTIASPADSQADLYEGLSPGKLWLAVPDPAFD